MQRLGLNPWNLSVGGVLGLLLFLAGAQVSSWIPQRPPFEASNLRYWKTEDGKQQIFEIDLTAHERCGHVLLDRVFVNVTNGQTFRRKAIQAPFNPEPVVPVLIEPGFYENLRWVYGTEPDAAGSFRLWVSPNECQSGYDKTFSLFNAPFDWRAKP